MSSNWLYWQLYFISQSPTLPTIHWAGWDHQDHPVTSRPGIVSTSHSSHTSLNNFSYNWHSSYISHSSHISLNNYIALTSLLITILTTVIALTTLTSLTSLLITILTTVIALTTLTALTSLLITILTTVKTLSYNSHSSHSFVLVPSHFIKLQSISISANSAQKTENYLSSNRE